VVLSRQFADTDYLLYLPNSANTDKPLRALVAFRGAGDKPEEFASSLVPAAEANGWLLIVPNYVYGDFLKVETLKADGSRHLPWVRALLQVLPVETSLQLQEKVLLYGFSRGAQAAHRFALMYPCQVLAVATMSAGTYTVPQSVTQGPNGHAPLDFPLGVSDLDHYCGSPFNPASVKQVSFWVGVGDKDTNAGDVPPDWDRYIGNTRVDRARAFAKEMADLGATVDLRLFPNLGHAESSQSRDSALAFLRTVEDRAGSQAAADQTALPSGS
jgi:pimeloyl-ACP methyl ester carboxylesterase